MIELYTSSTPNGQKVSIMLEEVELPYEVREIRLDRKEQKEEWFLNLNPNGRIPVIVDREAGITVFESGAILMYLAEKTGKFLPKDVKKRYQVIEWLMFQMGGIGPMQGQANVFYRYAPETIPYAIERYQKETRRLYEVLERQLEGRDYIAGDYSIADIATWPWVSVYEWAGVNIDGLQRLRAWLERVGERPAVRRGRNIPERREEEETDDLVQKGSRILV